MSELHRVFLKQGERLDRLKREKIAIIQSKEVFSFSLDAVLLAEFAQVPQKRKACIIDACSGNGAVAFLLSHKTQNKIYGIEYQELLIDMAKRTIALNGLSDKVDMIHGDYKNAEQWFKPDSVDVITCNPPYFEVLDSSLKNNKEAYTLARHEVALTLEDWIKQSSRLLKMGGKLYCVHRPDRLISIVEKMKHYALMPKRMQFVHPKQDKEANMVLIEAVKYGKESGLKISVPYIVFDEQNEYTPPIRSILYGE